MLILGIDPGLRHTGWGLVQKDQSRLVFVSAGLINADSSLALAERLAEIYESLVRVIDTFHPQEAAIEETFVNKNPNSTLKLGQARGVALLAPAMRHISVSEYTPNQIKKMVVGAGHADKNQVDMMVRKLLPTVPDNIPADSSDALAIALCHCFMRGAV